MAKKNDVNLNPVAALAVAKSVSESAYKAASSDLTPGEYEVDMVVRIQGKITKGEDYTQQIVEKAEPWLLIAAALSKLNGVTIESLVAEATQAPEDLIKDLKARAATAIAKIKAPTETRCNGKVTCKLAVAGAMAASPTLTEAINAVAQGQAEAGIKKVG